MVTTELMAPAKSRSRKNDDLERSGGEERAVPARAVESQEIYDWFNPNQLHWKNIDWVVLIWMVGIHVGAWPPRSSSAGRLLASQSSCTG